MYINKSPLKLTLFNGCNVFHAFVKRCGLTSSDPENSMCVVCHYTPACTRSVNDTLIPIPQGGIGISVSLVGRSGGRAVGRKSCVANYFLSF